MEKRRDHWGTICHVFSGPQLALRPDVEPTPNRYPFLAGNAEALAYNPDLRALSLARRLPNSTGQTLKQERFRLTMRSLRSRSMRLFLDERTAQVCDSETHPVWNRFRLTPPSLPRHEKSSKKALDPEIAPDIRPNDACVGFRRSRRSHRLRRLPKPESNCVKIKIAQLNFRTHTTFGPKASQQSRSVNTHSGHEHCEAGRAWAG
jgi:hypothetical protein